METSLRFIEHIARTPAAVSCRFRRPQGFTFQAGQYMLLWPEPGGSLVHPLSFSSGPQEDVLEFTKRLTGSVYCQALERLRPGDRIIGKGPLGSFSAEGVSGAIVCLAGGIGITPVRSILSDLASRRDPRPVTLIYGNLNEGDIAFEQELASLNLPNFRLAHVLQQPGGKLKAYAGFINAEIIRAEVKDIAVSTFLISGPPGMVKAMEHQLVSLGVGPERIRTDRFLGYADTAAG
jgi:ferredoxin-NADP reductase